MSGYDSERIAVLSADVANQIAAGEVIERPASAVKELVDNAIDAGATRIEIELERGGAGLIRVLDDGCGIHGDDLCLALTRHATSKIRSADQLEDLHSLGFRGEALASIAGVANLTLRSRRKQESIGKQVSVTSGADQQSSSAGMPVGTQVEIHDLFGSIPARKKFLRGESTETGHCCEAVLRIALVHNAVHFALRTGKREHMMFPVSNRSDRVQQVLSRRGEGSFFEFSGEQMGVRVWGCFGWPQNAIRSRNGIFIVVRRRVVRERNLSQIVQRSYGDAIGPDKFPVACLFVDPLPGSVDVNVHPQKTEVRFSDAQSVYAVVREILAHALMCAPWRCQTEGANNDNRVRDRISSQIRVGQDQFSAAKPILTSHSYRLPTQAKSIDYDQHKRQLISQVDHLRDARRADPIRNFDETIPLAWTALKEVHDVPVPERQPEAKTEPEFELLRVLPGPVALFAHVETIVAVDLCRLRTHLLQKRLERDLGGGGVEAQTLLQPVLVQKHPEEVQLCCDQAEALLMLGIVLESFGSNSLLVRAVPAQLCRCMEDADISDLLDRVLPWLRLRTRGLDQSESKFDIAVAIAHTKARDPTARMARNWMAQLKAIGNWQSAPGIAQWTSAQLVAQKK